MEVDDDLSQATQESTPPPPRQTSTRNMTDGTWGMLVPLEPELMPIPLEKEELIFGRHRGCTFTFSDLRVSKKHCRLFRTQTSASLHDSINSSQEERLQFFLEDLSSNGTYVNKQKLGRGNTTLLCHGDTIDLLMTGGPDGEAMYKISYMFKDLSLDEKEPPEPTEITERYDIKQQIGKGNFSEVFLGINKKTAEPVAVKKIDKKKISAKARENIMREADILTRLSHPNIVRIKDFMDSDRFLYLVLELASGGELFDKVAKGALTEEKSKQIFSQVLQAVAYLHKQGIVHRDLKPENIMFERARSSTVKVTDFGLAKLLGSKEYLTTLCGTPLYVAPEIVTATKGVGQGKLYGGKQVDAWSLGVLLYVMLSGEPPFEENDFELSLFDQIELGMYDFPQKLWGHISAEAKDLVGKLLVLDPMKRLSVENALRHPWLQANKENLELPKNITPNSPSHLKRYNTPISPVRKNTPYTPPCKSRGSSVSLSDDSLCDVMSPPQERKRKRTTKQQKQQKSSPPETSPLFSRTASSTESPTVSLGRTPRFTPPEAPHRKGAAGGSPIKKSRGPMDREAAVVLGGPKAVMKAKEEAAEPAVKKRKVAPPTTTGGVRVSGLRRSNSAAASRRAGGGGKNGGGGFALAKGFAPLELAK